MSDLKLFVKAAGFFENPLFIGEVAGLITAAVGVDNLGSEGGDLVRASESFAFDSQRLRISLKGLIDFFQPVVVGEAIVVGESNDFSLGFLDA